MMSLPASTVPGRNAISTEASFALLAVAVALATAGAVALAALHGGMAPFLPSIGLAIAGLVIGGRQLWPAVVLGAFGALLAQPHGDPPLLDLLAALAEASTAWLGASVIPEVENGRLRQPTLFHLLALAGAIVGVCVGGAALGSVLRGVPIEGTETLRALAIDVPLQVALAWSVLLWSGTAARGGSARGIAGAAGLVFMGSAVFFALGVVPGIWVAIPPLLWAAGAYRQRANAAALALLGCAALAAFAASVDAAPIPAELAGFLTLVTLAVVLVQSIGGARHGSVATPDSKHDSELNAFVADAPVAIAALDRDLRYRAVSRRYLRDLRLEDRPSIIGLRPADVHAPYAAHLGDGLERALAGEKVSRPAGKVRMADGACEYLRSELQPWHDADGVIGGVMVFGEIATDAVRSRAALEEAETRYRGVFEQAAAGFARCGLDGRFLEVNDRFCEITGHDRAALLAKTYRDITHPLDIASSDRMLEAMIANPGERFSVEKRYCTRDGRVVWVNMSTTMIRDAEGRPLYAASAVQDITARKDAQAALAKSELRLRLAQSAARAGLWEIDFERQTIIASADMLRMHGVSPDRTDGVPLAEWRALFDKATLDQIDSSGFASREVNHHDMIYAVERPDGSQRWIHSMGRTYRTTDNNKRIIGLAIDVTAAQAAQAELRHAQATMLRVSHLSAMGSVAATLAHELNQPLAAIVNYIQVSAHLLKAQGDATPPQLLDAILQAQAQAMRAGQLVQKLRTLTPNSAAARRRESVAAILDHACATIAQEAAAENVVIRRHGESDAEILADRLQIEQVLLGIFHNAIEAMQDCTDKQIDLGIATRGETVVIRVADSGPGVPPATLQHVFEPFADPRGRGSGLALPVCRTIVESHDGKLTAEPASEGGAAFVITLPIAPRRQPPRHFDQPDPLPERATPPVPTTENTPR